jgi:4-diphosphocytidyl-2-C-methyl-D-erythritol kinase
MARPRFVASRVSCRAPAKVNLVLRVLGTRADGYHLLETLMVPISLYDDVVLEVAPGTGRVRCSVDGPEKIAGGRDNIAAAAARAVLAATGRGADVDVHLTKRIPPGAGLGGGSSDAAAVLRLLPRALGCPLAQPSVAAMAAGLGADVPFFLRCRPAWATGIGDRLQSVSDFPVLSLCVAVPRARVNTAWAYSNALPRRAHLRIPEPDPLGPDANRLRLTTKSLSCLIFNDFERGVRRACEDVGRLLARMRKLGAVAAVMSGSGSAVVGMFGSEREARHASVHLGASWAAGLSSTDRKRRSGDLAFAVRVLRRLPPPAV